MAQDRLLRAEMRTSEKVNSWPIPVRYFWAMLWGYCDDWGRGRYDARLINADTFPLDDEVTAVHVERWMRALEEAGVIVAYEVGGKRYFECTGWFEHNPDLKYLRKTNVPDQSGIIPKPGKVSEHLQKVLEDSARREGKGREAEEEGESAVGAPPSEFCSKHPKGTDAPCRACGDARRARAAHDAAQRTAPTVRPPKSGECAHREHPSSPGYCAKCGDPIGVAA
ncbi:hypothetical protein [Agromyces sp. NPDC058064]|uniref:hypothetical protein n=1 Tax=Agromyces sp. NPDC058064 TaxID=3346322 RepID=UPI0036DE031B